MSDAFLRIEKLTRGRVEGYELWEQIPLSRDTKIIARPSVEPNSIEPDVKIVGDDYISRTPVEINYSDVDGCYIIRDYGTTNGTFLNGELIEKDGRPYRLKDYDLIALAKVGGEMRVVFRFRLSHLTQPAWVSEDPWRPSAVKGLSVNTAAKKVFIDGHEIDLTRTEWKIFEVLYAERGKVCTIDDIAWDVWGTKGASAELVAKYIQRLRDRIEPDRSKPRYIITHSAGGYILEL